MKKALIFRGGWDGHHPIETSDIIAGKLRAAGVAVDVHDTKECLLDPDLKTKYSLIVPVWTMGEITAGQCQAVCKVVESGTGMAGCHGGMCDAFRASPEWQFMTGGQWVAHPGDAGVTYTVEITDQSHPVTAGLGDFTVTSEQYYLHTDPGNHVLAVTRFPHKDFAGPHSGNPCKVPQVWVKSFGLGRVFYSALGHVPADIASGPSKEMLRRGCVWAAR